ncbi:hypothetical protein FCV25MIE_11643 [Fagus crenata]
MWRTGSVGNTGSAGRMGSVSNTGSGWSVGTVGNTGSGGSVGSVEPPAKKAAERKVPGQSFCAFPGSISKLVCKDELFPPSLRVKGLAQRPTQGKLKLIENEESVWSASS